MAFGREMLSSHSLKGESGKCAKPALPAEKVEALFGKLIGWSETCRYLLLKRGFFIQTTISIVMLGSVFTFVAGVNIPTMF